MPLKVEELLAPITAESPCGESLQYDRRAMEVLRLAEGKDASVMGDQVIAAEEPDWREVRDGCVELLGRSKDLRLAVVLSLAMLKLEGLDGFGQALALVRGYLERYWASVNPVYDPSDGDGPIERANILSSYAAPLGTYGDKLRFAERLMDVPLCDSRQWGRYGLRHVRVASGALAASPVEGAAAPDLKVIDRAFEDTDVQILHATEAQAAAVVGNAEAIQRAFEAGAGSAGGSPDLSEFLKLVRDAHGLVKRQMERVAGGAGVESPGVETPGSGAVSGVGSGAGSVAGGALRVEGELSSREQVSALLEKIYRYYERAEPSSPVPLIMKSCEKMVGKRFTDIVKVLTPDAVALLERLAAPEEPAAS